MRVVSLAPASTFALAHLDSLDLVVARDAWSGWPGERVATIPIVGAIPKLQPQMLARLEPDVVVLTRSAPGVDRLLPSLVAAGLPLFVIDPLDWASTLRMLEELSARIGRAQVGAQVVAKARDHVAALQAAAADLEWRTVLLEWSPQPHIVAFGDSWANEALEWVHLRNAFGGRPGQSGRLTPLEAVAVDPDLWVVSWCGCTFEDYDPSSVADRFAGSGLRVASDRNRVVPVWEELLGYPSLRLLEGAQALLDHRLTGNL